MVGTNLNLYNKDLYNCYLHIPFCDLKCKYCRFASVIKTQELYILKYINFLCEEIINSEFESKKLNTIYFGGGTPSILSKNNLYKILNKLENKFGFSKNIEITIESTPNNITVQNLLDWNELGINRISIGIQTLNEKSLKEINRGEKGDIKKALDNLKKISKIDNINLDFIIGLPYVKNGEILENIKYVLQNYDFIKHISVYMLEEYYNEDKIKETKFDNITYPEKWKKLGIREEDFLQEYSSIKNFLNKNGFYNYEISNFARVGYECKHNKGYWEHKEVVAFGMGAAGFIDNSRYLNSDNFKDYYAGKKVFINDLDKQDIFLEELIFQLRTSGIIKKNYKKLNLEKINFFIENNFLYIENNLLKLTDSGVLVLDYILKEIL